MSAFLGGDPGSSGGFAVVTDSGEAFVWPWPGTEVDVVRLCEVIASEWPGVTGLVEKVGAMPGQGVTSMFSFGRSYGTMRVALLGAGIGFDDITPRSWQRVYGMSKTKGESKSSWKNRLKGRAQQLYPNLKGITQKTADALLIAHAHMKMSS